MYTKSTLFALMASGLAAAIPVPHEQLSLTTSSLSTEHPNETPTTSIPGYGSTGGEITATVTVPGYQQNTPDTAVATPTTSSEHGLAVSSTDIYTSTEVRQGIVVSTPAPQAPTPTPNPTRKGGANVPAVEKPEVPTITNSHAPSNTSPPSVEYPEITKPGTDAPSTETSEVRKPSTDVPSVESPEISKPSTTVEHPEIKPTEPPKVKHPEVKKPTVESPSVEHPGVEKTSTTVEYPEIKPTEATSVEHPEVEKPSTTAPSVEYPEVKSTNISVPSGSVAQMTSVTDIPSPTFTAEVQKPGTGAPSVGHPEIKPTEVKPNVSAPTVTDVKKPEHDDEHRNGPSVTQPSVPDVTGVNSGDDNEHKNIPSVNPSAPDVTKTKDQEYKVPEVSPPTPSYTTTSVPEFQRPSGTPDVDGIKSKTEGDAPKPNTSDVSIPKTDDTTKPRTGEVSPPNTDDIKGKGVKGSTEYEVNDDGEWEVEYTHGE